MKDMLSSPDPSSAANWKPLGELELRAGAEATADSAIQAWLADILAPLDLHTDLLSKILRSAREAAARALESSEKAVRYAHIHLLAFAPYGQRARGQTWGFFRLEKLDGSAPGQSRPDHSIEFYLYLEGRPEVQRSE